MRISRNKAKKWLAEKQLPELSDSQILDMLGEYWNYDSLDEILADINSCELPKISRKIAKLIATTEYPKHPLPDGTDLLLIDYLIRGLDKVLNTYIQKKLREYGLEYEVFGKKGRAGQCPCCKYYSIDPDNGGLWDICPVCFWENGGDGPNHMNIIEAQKNFLKIGAISEQATKFVDVDGKSKYAI